MLADVNRMAHVVKEGNIRLDPEDTISTKLWVEILKEKNISTFYKLKLDCPSPDSGLQGNMFVLCIQTTFQLDMFWRLSSWFIRIDTTHNTTQYEEVQLFTVIARDCWGYGV